MGALSYFIQQALSGTPNDKSIAYRVRTFIFITTIFCESPAQAQMPY
jgi:hypothetical protein